MLNKNMEKWMFRKEARIKSKRKARLFRRDYKSAGPITTGFEKFAFAVLVLMFCFVVYNIVLALRMV